MKTKLSRITLVALVASLALLATSCLSIQLSNMKDDELVKAGIEQWNTKKPEDAKPYWSNIKDDGLKTKYLAYYDRLDELDAAYDAVLAVPLTQDAKAAEAFQAFIKKYEAYPKDVKMFQDYKPALRPLTVAVVKARIKAGKLDSAKDFIKLSNNFLGESDAYDTQIQEMESITKLAGLEKNALQVLEDARAVEDFNDKIAAYENAIASYVKVENAAAEEIRKYNAADDSPLAAVNTKLRKKRQDARMEMERQLRERGQSFKERIGEEFARQPDPDKVGNMTGDDILKFNQETRDRVEAAHQELLAFAARYPTVIDKDMIKDVEDQQTALNEKIAQITTEVKIAKDIASRGKAIMPLLIGLFNPQPGTKAEEKKSRPAKFKTSMKGENDYWWGMVSIEPGKMNDLVFTINDNREVQVFNENTLSGTMITVKNLKNLISKSSKVGNSWPVLNAGAQLPSGKYFFQVQKGKTPNYSGEVVVYSSFIARMR